MAKSRTLFLLTGLLSLFTYIFTLAPTITWQNAGSDSGDLAAAVAVGGVPHPPGYPTYLILAEVFKLLPFGDIAYRLNLLSATCAALTIAVVGLIIHHTLSATSLHQVPLETGENCKTVGLTWLSATTASLTLAFSAIFWSQAVIAEVYALNALFAAVLIYGALRVQPANERWLVPALFVVLGLSLGNHPSIFLLLPMLIWILKTRWRWRLVFAALVSTCAGLCVYLVIPLRAAASPPINWGMATSLPNFVWLVTAQLYGQFLFTLPWNHVPARVVTELHLLTAMSMWWALPVGVFGVVRLSQLNRSLACSSLITFLLFSMYAIGYNTTDSHVYLLPALMVFYLWVGWGLYGLGIAVRESMKSRSRSVDLLVWGFLLLPILSLFSNFPNQDISRDDEARSYAQQNLQLVAPGAVIIADNDPQTFALWYGRYGLVLRSDVAIINSNLLPYAWYRQALGQTHANLRLIDQRGQPLTTLPAFIKWNLPNSPIYLATMQPPPMEGYHLEPVMQLHQVKQLTVD
jgi:hypothetical protein